MGLLAATWGRLYSSTFYALRDTRTPLRFAVIRVTLTVLAMVASLGVLTLRLSAQSEELQRRLAQRQQEQHQRQPMQ